MKAEGQYEVQVCGSLENRKQQLKRAEDMEEVGTGGGTVDMMKHEMSEDVRGRAMETFQYCGR